MSTNYRKISELPLVTKANDDDLLYLSHYAEGYKSRCIKIKDLIKSTSLIDEDGNIRLGQDQEADCKESILIGNDASATADNCIQIGAGVNEESHTIKIGNFTLMSLVTGLIEAGRLPIAAKNKYGIVKIGAGLKVANGVISATGGGGGSVDVNPNDKILYIDQEDYLNAVLTLGLNGNILLLKGIEGVEVARADLSSITISQEQLNKKLDKSGGTITGDLEVQGNVTLPVIDKITAGNTSLVEALGIDVIESNITELIADVAYLDANKQNKLDVQAALFLDNNKLYLKLNAQDKLLAQDDNGLSTTISMDYVKNDNKIYLRGKGGVVISEVDATDFVTGSSIKDVELVVNPEGKPAGTYLKITFATTEGDKSVFCDVSTLIDVYTGEDGIKVLGQKIKHTNSVTAINEFAPRKFKIDAQGHITAYDNLTKSDLGLGNVDNTSDANKPVSTAQAAAIKVVSDKLGDLSNLETVNKTTLVDAINDAYLADSNSGAFIINSERNDNASPYGFLFRLLDYNYTVLGHQVNNASITVLGATGDYATAAVYAKVVKVGNPSALIQYNTPSKTQLDLSVIAVSTNKIQIPINGQAEFLFNNLTLNGDGTYMVMLQATNEATLNAALTATRIGANNAVNTHYAKLISNVASGIFSFFEATAAFKITGELSVIDRDTKSTYQNKELKYSSEEVKALDRKKLDTPASISPIGTLGAYKIKTNGYGFITEYSQFYPIELKIDKNGAYTAVMLGTTISNTRGKRSISIGESNDAQGETAIALGNHVLSQGIRAYSFGYRISNSGNNSVASGTDIFIEEGYSYTYVWSGIKLDEDVVANRYKSNGNGTYNINPVGGIEGFYIGTSKLSDLIVSRIGLACVDGSIVVENGKISAVAKTKATFTTNTAVGNIAKGTTIEAGTSLDAILKQLLVTYINPSFSSFACAGFNTDTVEVGTSVAVSNANCTWGYTDETYTYDNIQDNTLKIQFNGTNLKTGISKASKVGTSYGTTGVTFTAQRTGSDGKGTRVLKVIGTNTKGNDFERSISKSWAFKYKYGSFTGNRSGLNIQNMGTSKFSPGNSTTFDITIDPTHTLVWFCYPKDQITNNYSIIQTTSLNADVTATFTKEEVEYTLPDNSKKTYCVVYYQFSEAPGKTENYKVTL